MKKKIEISIFIITLVTSLVMGHSLFAQESSPLGKLAQDYILRLNEESKDVVLTDSQIQDTTVVNPEAVTREAVTESIDTITKTVDTVETIKQETISDIKASVKDDIDNSIIRIRQESEKPAYELQSAIDIERTELFENVTQTIESIEPTTIEQSDQKIQNLQTEIDTSLNKIKTNLEAESGLEVNFETSQRDIEETLIRFQKTIEEKQEIIESRQGALVFEDTDNDGVSDYDELYIYETDPNKSRTIGEGKTDGEKIIQGINPLSSGEEKIQHQDPREDKESFVSDSYTVEKVELIKEGKEKLIFNGKALPNTYITLYIFSTPIIVTVKTDQNGQWNYELEKELENGEHQIYVATVDTSGKIIARSNPILFTKSAEAATIGIAGTINTSVSTQNFLKDNFILITLATLILIVILGMMFVGNHTSIRSAVSELKNEVNSK